VVTHHDVVVAVLGDDVEDVGTDRLRRPEVEVDVGADRQVVVEVYGVENVAGAFEHRLGVDAARVGDVDDVEGGVVARRHIHGVPERPEAAV